MTEYIRKEQALEAILSAIELTGEQWVQVWNKIKQTPAADVAPVRHGRWTRIDYHDARCSECGHKTYYPDQISLYCPECGARMDGGKSNAD